MRRLDDDGQGDNNVVMVTVTNHLDLGKPSIAYADGDQLDLIEARRSARLAQTRLAVFRGVLIRIATMVDRSIDRQIKRKGKPARMLVVVQRMIRRAVNPASSLPADVAMADLVEWAKRDHGCDCQHCRRLRAAAKMVDMGR